MQIRLFRAMGMLLAVVALSACAAPAASPAATLPPAAAPPPPVQPAPTLNPTGSLPTPTECPCSATEEATVIPIGPAPINSESAGLTYEESQSINPPPPDGLTAVRVAEGIKIYWKTPPLVTVKHYYTDVILYYKVYRRTEGSSFTFLAQTAELEYIDRTAAPGIKYYYTVTAMHENEIEGLRPNEVSAP